MGRNETRVRWSDITNYTPKQLEAKAAVERARFVLYGGTRGPGKSYFLRYMLVELMIYWHLQGISKVHTMLGCESYPVLQDRQISKINSEFPPWLGEIKDTQQDGLGFYLKPAYGGGIMKLRNLDKPEKYKGMEIAALGVDQAEQIPLSTFETLRGSMRWPGIKDTKFIGTGNPGGIGHAWNVAYWLDKVYPPELLPYKDEFVFIRAKPEDNPHLDKQYWDDLRSLPPKLQKAWLEGDYKVFSGQAFPTFSYDRHTVDPFEIPSIWPKWRGLDWGLAAPFCCLWVTKDIDRGRIYVYREAYGAELSDTQQARIIREMTPPNEYVSITYADPSLWNRKTMGLLVSSTAEEFGKNGVYLTRADNDRLSGKRKVDRLLPDLPDGLPGIQVFRTCPNLIRTLPYLIFDEHKKEDVDTTQEDHAFDALKYALTNTILLNRLEKKSVKQALQNARYL